MPILTFHDDFVMRGARAAMTAGLAHIEEQVKALEEAVSENTGLAFDLAKTIIESTCKTIISERGGEYENDDDLPRLFKLATQTLPFLPASVAGEADASRSLRKTLNGLNTAVQGICELRNEFGFVSHGSDSARPAMEYAQGLLVAQSADTIIGFLYQVHRQELTRPRATRLAYEDNSELNDWIDEQSEPVQILTLPPYRPSEVLFHVDVDAYRDMLANYQSEPQEGEQANTSDGTTEVSQ